jgi:hypothetical protein
MRDLMVGDGKSSRGTGVEQLIAKFVAHGDMTVAAQHAVQMHRARHLVDTIFRKHHHARLALGVVIKQIAHHRVERAQLGPNPSTVRALLL